MVTKIPEKRRRHRNFIRLQFEQLERRDLLSATDVSVIPVWDGETFGHADPLMNRFGGNPGVMRDATLERTTNPTDVRTGVGAYEIRTTRTLPVNDFGFVTSLLTGQFESNADYIDSRDLTGFDHVQFWIKNATGSPFNLKFEIQDYRLDSANSAFKTTEITGSTDWQPIDIDLNDALQNGSPDLSRAKQFAFVIETRANNVQGSVFLDDLTITESGETLNPQTANRDDLVDRIAHRQFRALWGSKDARNGLVPRNSFQADEGALNSTSGLIQLLPTAIEREWISSQQADQYIGQIVDTFHTVWNNVQTNTATQNGGFIPPRYMDRFTLEATSNEESPIDAAFLFLSLYGYKSLTSTPQSTSDAIDGLLSRFDFSKFSLSNGWSRAFNYSSGLDQGTYNGYSGEVYVISLAAHLSPTIENRIDIATHWNSATLRDRASLFDSQDPRFSPSLGHSFKDSSDKYLFREPFLQWLFPLFVDTSERGDDTYDPPALAGNPSKNAVEYQQDAHRFLESIGRAIYAQPDAGDDGRNGGDTYHEFSLYNDFGSPNVFMPWSVAFSFLAEPDFAEAALRNHFVLDLQGPLGLSDSAEITDAETFVRLPAQHDFWNIALSTMAFTNYLTKNATQFAQLPEVVAALDKVFLPPTVSVVVAPLAVNEEGTAALVYTFTRTGDTTDALAVTYTVSGTATPGSDFTALSDTITIPAGQASAALSIDPTDDTTVEPDETIILTVTDATAYDVGTPEAATGTITDDGAGQIAMASPASQSVAVNDTFTVTTNYNTIPAMQTTGLSLRLHYNSNLVSFDVKDITLGAGVPQTAGSPFIGDDTTEDGDNDPTTNIYVRVDFVDFNGTFPSELTPLFDATFTATAVGTANFNYSFPNAAGTTSSTPGMVTISANAAPVINSDGGGATAAISVPENIAFVTDVQSTDADGDTEVSGLIYSLTTASGGGADNGLFTLNPTGVLTFKVAPDFENPADANTDNAYLVQVTVTDSGSLTDRQDITVTVVPDAVLDVTGSGNSNPFQDGILIVRFMLGQPDDPNLSDPALYPADATRTTGAEVRAHLEAAGDLLDANGDGTVNPFQDGILIVRFLLGQPDDPNLSDPALIPAGSTRTTGAEIRAYLKTLLPPASGGELVTLGSGEGEADVNGDGSVSMRDALNVINAVDRRISNAELAWTEFDAIRNGRVTTADALLVVERVAEGAVIGEADRKSSTVVDRLLSDEEFLHDLL